MNGRVYDPVLARFMSADPYIQSPDALQSYNRYAYVWNNPLASMDPSGYFNLGHALSSAWHGVWRNPVGRTVVTMVAAYYTGNLVNGWLTNSAMAAGTSNAFVSVQFLETTGTLTSSLTTLGGITVGASAGFVGGLVGSGGDLNAGLSGAVGGGIGGGISGYFGTHYTWERVVANSVSGGIESRLRGGRFAEGFKTSFGFSAITYMAASMRRFEWEESQKNPNNSSGESASCWLGTCGKLGGERQIETAEGILKPMEGRGGIFGGWQGKGGRFLWMDYLPNSWQDHVVEAFSRVHDFLNHPIWYNANGNQRELTGLVGWLGERASDLNVLLAAPIVAVSAVPETLYGNRWVRK